MSILDLCLSQKNSCARVYFAVGGWSCFKMRHSKIENLLRLSINPLQAYATNHNLFIF